MNNRAKETWADIHGYEGKYKVSNLGNVRSLDRKRKTHSNSYAKIKGVALKNVIANTGYFVVNLCGKTHLVHRLTAEAFIPNPQRLQWAKATGITYNTLYSRIFLHCWPIDKALTVSPNHGNNIKKLLEE